MLIINERRKCKTKSGGGEIIFRIKAIVRPTLNPKRQLFNKIFLLSDDPCCHSPINSSKFCGFQFINYCVYPLPVRVLRFNNTRVRFVQLSTSL